MCLFKGEKQHLKCEWKGDLVRQNHNNDFLCTKRLGLRLPYKDIRYSCLLQTLAEILCIRYGIPVERINSLYKKWCQEKKG